MSDNRILRERVAGQSAMSDVVRAQAAAPARTLLARIVGVSPLTPESRASYRGALGELLVGDVLENLGPRWDVLHDLPLGSSVLDHLLIGPAGVFAVRVTNRSAQDVAIDDSSLVPAECDEIQQAAAEAKETAGILGRAAGQPVEVSALVVVVGPRRLPATGPGEVRMVSSRDLEHMLGRAPHSLGGDEVARISDVADLASTWPRASGSDLDTGQLHRDFAVVRSQVRAALGRRLLWAAAGFGLLYSVVWGLIAAIVGLVVHP